MASLSFSPRYAAPEVLRAYDAGERTVAVTSAMDMWALGVMAYELLTDMPAFPRNMRQAQIVESLVGRAALPWESPAAPLSQLRMLKRSIIKCLSRDPAERPSAADLLKAWNKMFDQIAADTASVAPPT